MRATLQLVNETKSVSRGDVKAGVEASLEKWVSVTAAIDTVKDWVVTRCGVCHSQGYDSPAKTCPKDCPMYSTCLRIDSTLLPILDEAEAEVDTVVKHLVRYQVELDRQDYESRVALALADRVRVYLNWS